MDGALKKIDLLLAQGEQFTYENFADKSERGYTSAFSPDWVSWQARVTGAVSGLFSEQSAPVMMIENARRTQLVGNGADAFARAKSHYIGALKAACDIITDDTFGELAIASSKTPEIASNRIFIVHGHDDVAKSDLEAILTEMGFEPVILHRQADGGRTVIEKFEDNADVGYAFIILTPDEIAYLQSEDAKPDAERSKEYRARPNVIFEFGYFVGRLGRARTCCLYKGAVSIPSDLSGLVYKRFNRAVEEVAYSIRKELKNAGYSPR